MLNLAVEDGQTLPILPDAAIVQTLLLPAEQLLSRTFHLPFSNPKFIDQDILAQELEEHTSESSESWWLAWQAAKYDDGVAGIMLGLPESLHQQIAEHPNWQHAHYITSDIWLRLNNLNDQHDQLSVNDHPEINPSKADLAVFDTDSSGIFFGLWHASEANNAPGFWRAMRRLNWAEASTPPASLVEDIKRSLLSMGWQAEHAIAIGRLSPDLHAALQLLNWQGHLCDADALPSRADATIDAASASGMAALTTSSSLNFRHGRWRSGSHLSQLKAWYRSMAWAAILMLLWSANMAWQNHQLQTAIVTQQQAITQAFHSGLPNESVMIDALAQLRKASGGDTYAAGSSNRKLAAQWLHHIESINAVYRQTPWTINSISFQQGIMSMTGQTGDLQSMNRLLKALQQKSGLDIKIQDTDLSQNQVRFKMLWP